uniref:Myosin IXB n=1 Tax=Pygocentrus nattereri TaxID=42514 RepID=A0AAR2IWK0_PYGNA
MSFPESRKSAYLDEATYVLQIYPRLSLKTAQCCTLNVHKEATAAWVIQIAAVTLGLDKSKPYQLVEVRETGGEEWVLQASDRPVERLLLWPRKVQDQHLQIHGYYFALQSGVPDGPSQSERVLYVRSFLKPQSEDCNDLCSLPVLTEKNILEALRRRFLKNQIYTYANNILIAVNPFKFLPIYNPKYVEMYENHTLGRLNPHVFAIADAAFRAMLNKRLNQCIVISGESGSGKTQSTNFLIHCLTAFSRKGCTSGVERTILGAGPVLEAFGNAKTAYNNNSSRFGKFIQVNFLEGGVVRGATIEKYLLEKCRLVSRKSCERNYHVFYYLLVGASDEEREEFKLQEPEDYHYLRQDNPHLEDQAEIQYEFKRLHQAMEMVGFLPATKKQIFSVLSAILYLGNLTYEAKADGEGLTVGPADVLSTLSDLLKVKKEPLVEALTKRRAMTANDVLILPYTLSEAITARDSMAKSLYSSLFDWIVLRINHALLNKRDMEESVPCLSIGVLDIFGFEDFRTNSFEQFCINYANEQLQHYCNQHIFRLEQEEYVSEGITWSNVEYTDNIGCINLISKKPTGLLYLLDEESSFPHATDNTLLEKFKQQHQENLFFVPTPVMEPAFVILHYAGKVKYQIKDFRAKNTDHMRPDMVALLRSSERGYLRQLIGSDPVAVFRWGILRAVVRTVATFKEAGRRWVTEHPGNIRSLSPECKELHAKVLCTIKRLGGEVPQKLRLSTISNLIDSRALKLIVDLNLHNRDTRSLLHLHKKKKPPSISAQFQTSLVRLLDTLKKAEPFFVRCIRSNAEKREMQFDEDLVLKQLRYTGMLETVRIKRSGYGAKYTFKEFTDEFRVLLPKNPSTPQKDITNLLRRTGLDDSSFQIGKTKVFLKEVDRQKLQETLHREVMHRILLLQRWFRACLTRKHFLMKRKAIITLQVLIRALELCFAQQHHPNNFIDTFFPLFPDVAPELDCEHRCSHSHWNSYTFTLRRAEEARLSGAESAKGSPGAEERKGEASLTPGGKTKPLPPLPNQAVSPGNKSVEEKSSHVSTSAEDPSGKFNGQEQASVPGQRARGEKERRDKENESPSPAPTRPGTLDLSSGPKLAQPVQDDSSNTAPLQRYSKPSTMKEKVEKWKERRSEILPPDRSSLKDQQLENQKLKSLNEWKHKVGVSNKVASEWKPKVGVSNKVASEWKHKVGVSNKVASEWKHKVGVSNKVASEFYLCSWCVQTQMNDLHSQAKVRSETEEIFLKATTQFRDTIKSMYSVSNPQVSYKGLLQGYKSKVTNLAGQKKKDEVPMVVNLFQSVLDNFIRAEIKKASLERASSDPAKVELERSVVPLDHCFSTYQVNIYQSCDLCSSYIWGMEKACMCSSCKMVCHKKCLSKIVLFCSKHVYRKIESGKSTAHFGVHVSSLTSNQTPVPVVMEMMLSYVELHGLYTEGIYRKSGSACKAKELHQLLETDPKSECLNNYPIHTVTGLIKCWLRELPEPLMTFSLYNDFLYAADLPEKSERLRAIYRKVEDLPAPNYNTLERLIFHLVRVAKEEAHNRMSANSLAIVFAPCVLRCPDVSDPLLSMKDLPRTTLCLEILIMEQTRRYEEKMKEIQQLEHAEALAIKQLTLQRKNTVREPYSAIRTFPPRLSPNAQEHEVMEPKYNLCYLLAETAARFYTTAAGWCC